MRALDQLSDLVALFDEWSIPDVALRTEKLFSSHISDLSRMIGLVLPRLDEIESHLNSFGDQPFDENARRLLLLAECALEAKHEVDQRAEA